MLHLVNLQEYNIQVCQDEYLTGKSPGKYQGFSWISTSLRNRPRVDVYLSGGSEDKYPSIPERWGSNPPGVNHLVV